MGTKTMASIAKPISIHASTFNVIKFPSTYFQVLRLIILIEINLFLVDPEFSLVIIQETTFKYGLNILLIHTITLLLKCIKTLFN